MAFEPLTRSSSDASASTVATAGNEASASAIAVRRAQLSKFCRRRASRKTPASTRPVCHMALSSVQALVNWLLVGEAFRMRGFSVAETGGGGPDGGIDLELRKGSEVFLVQCKQWRAYKVSVNAVRELFGVMASQGATGGFVVTSGTFTPDARSFVEGKNIELIDGSALKAMIDRVRATRLEMVSPEGAPASAQTSVQTATPSAKPTCPRCGGPMVKRIAKQGSNAGGAFWGCPAFSKCRGIKTIE